MANGLLSKDSDRKTRADTNSSGIRLSEMLQDLSQGKPATTTASQKVGSMMNGIGNKVGKFFTPPSENSGASGLNLSKKPIGNQPINTASGAMQDGITLQNSTQAQRQNASGVTPRATPNMILHNLMNAENSQSAQFEGRRPYEPRGAEQGNSGENNLTTPRNNLATTAGSQNMPSANIGSVQSGEMRQGSSLAQTNTATNSAQNMSGINSTPSQSTSSSTGSLAVNEMRQSANTSQSTVTTNAGNNSAIGAMGQSSAPVNQPNSVTPENTGQRSARSGE